MSFIFTNYSVRHKLSIFRLILSFCHSLNFFFYLSVFLFLSFCHSLFHLVTLVHISSSFFNFICLYFFPLLGGTRLWSLTVLDGLRWSQMVTDGLKSSCVISSHLRSSQVILVMRGHLQCYMLVWMDGWDGIGWLSQARGILGAPSSVLIKESGLWVLGTVSRKKLLFFWILSKLPTPPPLTPICPTCKTF